jgi:hypothetical protein
MTLLIADCKLGVVEESLHLRQISLVFATIPTLRLSCKHRHKHKTATGEAGFKIGAKACPD